VLSGANSWRVRSSNRVTFGEPNDETRTRGFAVEIGALVARAAGALVYLRVEARFGALAGAASTPADGDKWIGRYFPGCGPAAAHATMWLSCSRALSPASLKSESPNVRVLKFWACVHDGCRSRGLTMPNRPDRKYVDHPAPSVGLMVLLSIALGALLAVIPGLLRPSSPDASSGIRGLAWVVTPLAIGAIGFYFWPLYTTYYTVSQAGLEVRYGPWTRRYSWSEFVTAYWQKGVFATRIGWPSVTPCVRLTDGVLLKRREKRFGLYLTPNDSTAFLRRIGEFAPELTSESTL